MRMAVSRNGRKIDTCIIVDKPQGFKQGIKVIKKIGDELSGGKKYQAVCCGIAGMLDKEKTKLVSSPHLKKWVNKPLRKELKRVFKTKVFLENDADLGGLGEATYGSGKDKNIVAYIAFGTGIGGTRVTNKTVDPNVFGFEPGHQIIATGQKCYLPPYQLGEWEAMISGTALEKKYGKKSKLITSQAAWNYAHKYIIYGLYNIIRMWSPEIIVLGGGLMNNPNIKLSRVSSGLKKLFGLRSQAVPMIKRAKLGDYAGFYGALYHVKNNVK